MPKMPPLPPLTPPPPPAMTVNADVLDYIDTSHTWHTYTMYQCKLCPFDSLYEEETVDHLLKKHRPIPNQPFMAETPTERFYVPPEAPAVETPGGGEEPLVRLVEEPDPTPKEEI
jgi:hypothetical protein